MATEHIDDSAGPTVWTWVATVKFSVNERRCRRRSVYLFSKLLYGGGKKKKFLSPCEMFTRNPEINAPHRSPRSFLSVFFP